jgi:hypothetical protein
MPRRTNERQEIIELLKRVTAGPNCAVTGSKMLKDAVTGEEREVDVVAEYEVDGDRLVQSFEVTSKSRRADLTWVEQLVQKHRHLETDRLVLVSWKGFTKSARRLAEKNPRIVLVTPQMKAGPAAPEVKRLRSSTVQFSPKKVIFVVTTASNEAVRVVVEPDHRLYSSDRTEVGTAADLTQPTLRSRKVYELTMEEVDKHDGKEPLIGFLLEVPMPDDSDLHLHQFEIDELHRITQVEITGSFAHVSQPLGLEIREFLQQRFAHGRFDLMGTPHLLVASLSSSDEIVAAITKPQSGTGGDSVAQATTYTQANALTAARQQGSLRRPP